MPQFRQYPTTNATIASDVFLLDRIGAGTLGIDAADLLANTGGSSSPYDLSLGISGTPIANAGGDANAGIFTFWIAPRSVALQTIESDGYYNLNAFISFNVPPEACSTVMELSINGEVIGACGWPGGNPDATVSLNSGSYVLNAGDQLQFRAPDNWNNASTLSITIPLTVL